MTRVRRLAPQDAQDFAQSVHLQCLERDYAIFRRFSGRSSLRTYLRVVVTRLLLDWQNSAYGKWRQSATAARLGEPGMLLERLIERDGCTPDEAVSLLASQHPEWPAESLQQVADALPRRTRRRWISDETLEWQSALPFDDPVVAEEERHAREEIGRILRKAVKQLPLDDQRLVALRYGGAQSVRSLADRMQTEPKVLHRRFDRALRSLRRALTSAGVTSADSLAVAATRR